MKNNIKKLCGLLTLVTSLFLVGCDSNDDTGSVSVMSVSPAEQYVQDIATIEGTGLDQVQYVFVGQIEATFTVDGNTLSFEVPTAAKLGENVVTLAMKNNYRVTTEIGVLKKPIPAIYTVSTSAAGPGNNVTITGEFLEYSPQVTVGGVNATVVSSSTSELVFTVPTVPNKTLPVDIEITTTFGTITSTTIFYASENLIQNGNFELGTGDNFDSWGKWNGGAGITLASASDSYAGRTAKIVGANNNPWSTQFVSNAAATTPGVKYLVVMSYRAESTNALMRFSTNASGGASYGPDFNFGLQWQQITWEFTANSDATRVALDMGKTGETMFIDNIALVAQ